MLEYSNESLDRIKRLESLKKSWVIPYANRFERTTNNQELNKLWEKNDIKNINDLMNSWAQNTVKIAGRLMIFRSHGKLSFAKIRDWFWDIQICFVKDKVKFNTGRNIVNSLLIDDKEISSYKLVEKYFDIWDFIWVSWELFITKHWELTLFVNEYQMLSKAIRPLPEKFHWITDKETIYRQRYLDLTMNNDSYNRFLFRSEFVRLLRQFYHNNWFIEIETPILGNAASWAAAKPFITYHNDFDEEFYLRISPETALKKATVWRFERFFEFSRNFRNEWSDPSHVQEFTSVEHYCIYRNFQDNIDFTEKMFDFLFDKLWINKKLEVKDKDWITKEVDFTTPWQRIDYVEWVKKESWINIDLYSIDDAEKLRKDIKNKGITFEWIDDMWTTTLIDYLYKKVLRPKIIWPSFIYNYPKTMQPLARANDANPNIVEQFQVVVNGWEILKAYSELVDPIIQKSNFDEQSKIIDWWDEEATSSDDDFVLSMEYGMPCQSGWWMWIERIISILTEQSNLRDVILFPLMKPENSNKTKIKEFSIKDQEENFLSDDNVKDAEKLATKYLKDTYNHCLQVGRVMKFFANKLWEDENRWYIVWLLHDIDRDFIWKDSKKHCKQDLENILDEINLSEQIIDDIRSHAYFITWVNPETKIQKYIASVDELVWFIHAYSLMRPDWMKWIKSSSIIKKIKDKAFARWVDREQLKNCEKFLWIELKDFISQVIESMND